MEDYPINWDGAKILQHTIHTNDHGAGDEIGTVHPVHDRGPTL